ncbi:2-C-methyl-D-erythritol 2,4-cyclodiphosphate synthase [Raphidocelis subcapitata]|uniref:2-C-methyl-D-erythritol 2,4-cyclodiphosphate synthase n=1 Tax=Raphidocelis subcapitata TaxID=307507 RepID=A0A2V0NZZ2_9CHLO|nr:2-C-methyl-D-erythritol 2,4-cyclodiphosphate synthase [Raphidocelis subcapitata]|eukprot:GBF91163.1 2-C-methyl-D-erythritol 2,4-cyclodiphosphate synthase [Raphidocelis subcapitata]
MQRRSGARRGVRAAALVLLLCCCVRPSLQQEPAAAAPAEPAAPAAAAGAGGGAPAAGKSKVVELAPEVDVEHGDDIDPAGACAAFISSSSCKDVDAGEGQLAECISDLISEAEGEQESGSPAEAVPDACQGAVYDYYIKRSKNINANLPLAKACKEDALRHCNKTWFFGAGEGQIIACLIETKDAVSPDCRGQVFKAQRAAAADYRADPLLAEFCAGDAERLCPDVKPGGGRKQACLENKGRKDFGQPCLTEVTQYEQTASSDYRLNYRLRVNCKDDVAALCAASCPLEDRLCGGAVLRCLTDNQGRLRSAACRGEVLYFERMEVRDYRNDVILAAACRGDVEALCGDVQPGVNGSVHACLRDNRAKLSDACRREELLLESVEAEHIELRGNLLAACDRERGLFCKGVEAGGARVFRCLADNLADPDFGNTCRQEIITKLQRRQANWKLDPPLRRACRSDVSRLCKAEDAAASETGLVYKCLVSHADDLEGECRKELGRAVHMALFVWIPGSILTQPCDVDVADLCLASRPNMLHQPGEVAECLADALERIVAAEAPSWSASPPPGAPAPPRMSAPCRALADAAEPPSVESAFEASLSYSLFGGRLSALEAKTGVPLVSRDQTGHAEAITLSGWSALAGILALVATVTAGAAYGWRRWYGGPGDKSTVVLKSRGAYRRVGAGGLGE